MPSVGFEPTIPVFERAKTVHASDRAATVIGTFNYSHIKKYTGHFPLGGVLSRIFFITVMILYQSNVFSHS
jgi:hypothetical protein